MRNLLPVLVLCSVGCSAQPYEDIRVWAVTNTPDPNVTVIGVNGPITNTEPIRTLHIRSSDADVEDVVRRIAEHEGLVVEWQSEPAGRCTVDLSTEDSVDAIRSILELFKYSALHSNGTVTIGNGNPEQGAEGDALGRAP